MFHQAVSKNRLDCPVGLAPDPGQIGNRRVGKDQRGPRVGARELKRIASERWDSPAGVHEDRQPALVGKRKDPADRRIAQPEPLGAGMQLDPHRPATDRPFDLVHGAAPRVNPAECRQPTPGGLDRCEHPVVGGPVAGGFGQGEHHRAGIHRGECSEQLV
jgi:hypothetical protein